MRLRHRSGNRRARAAAATNTARYENVWLATSQDASGLTDQPTDAAVSTEKHANHPTVIAPHALARRPYRTTPRKSAAPITRQVISVHVLEPSDEPPCVTNTPAIRRPPRS